MEFEGFDEQLARAVGGVLERFAPVDASGLWSAEYQGLLSAMGAALLARAVAPGIEGDEADRALKAARLALESVGKLQGARIAGPSAAGGAVTVNVLAQAAREIAERREARLASGTAGEARATALPEPDTTAMCKASGPDAAS